MQLDDSWPAADVERFHGGGHQSNRTIRHEAAEGKPNDSARDPEAGGFADKCGENDTRTGAEGAHDSNLRPAANDRDGNGVVNKESANNQGYVAQEAQVPAEGRQHAAILVRAGALRTNFYSGRKHHAQTLLPVFQTGSLWHFQKNAIDAAIARQCTLGGSEVHHDGGFVAVRIGVDAPDRVMADLIVDEQFDAVSRLVANGRLHPDARRLSQILAHAFRCALRRRRTSTLGFSLRVST